MNELLLQIPIIGMEVEPFLLLLITALAGGAFGAAIGALPAFIFTGFVVFLGEGIGILQRQIGALEVIPAGELAAGEVPLANVVPCRDASRGTDVVEVVKVLPLLRKNWTHEEKFASVAGSR